MKNKLKNVTISDLFNAFPDGIIVTNLEGKIMMVNHKIEEIFGYTEDELLEQPIEMIVPERYANHEKHRENYNRLLTPHPMTTNQDLYGLRKDGSEIAIDVSLSMIKIQDDRFVVAFVVDKSHLEEVERSLRERNQHYSALFNHSPDAIFIISMEGIQMDANQSAAEMLGYTREELIGMPIEKVVVPREYPESLKMLERLLAGETLPAYERWFRRKDGTEIPVEISPALVTDDQNRPLYTQSIVRDISERKRVEESLRASERYNRLLFWDSPIGLVLTKMDGSLVDFNPAYAKIVGYSIEELRELTYWDLTPKVYEPQENDILKILHQGGRYGPYEKEYIHKDGHHIPVRLNGLQIERNHEKYIWSSVEDITERKRIEDEILRLNKELEDRVEERTRALRETEARFHWFTESAGDTLWMMDMEGNFNFISPSIERVSGFTPEEYLKKNFAEVIVSASLELAIGIYQDLLASAAKGEQYYLSERLELEHLRKDGSTYWTDVVPNILFDDNHKPLGIMGVTRDISVYHELREKLRESEARLQWFTDNAEDELWMMDLEGNYTYISPSVERTAGYTPEEFIQLNFTDEITPSSLPVAEKVFGELLNAIKKGEQYILSERLVLEEYRKDGSTYWTDTVPSILYDDNHQAIGLMGVSRDITESHLLQEKLKESEARYRAVIEDQTEFVVRWTPDGTLTFVNHQYATFVAQPEGDLIGQSLFQFMSSKNADIIQQDVRMLTPEHQTVVSEFNGKRLDGEVRWFHIIQHGIFDEQGNLVEIQSVGSDITARKQTEEALRNSETLFRAITEQAGEGITLADTKGKYFLVNAAFCEITGYTKEELLTMTVEDLLPNDVEMELFPSVKQGQPGVREVNLKKKNGDIFLSEVRVYPVVLENKKYILGFVRDVTLQKTQEVEGRLRSASLEATANAVVITQPDGTIIWVNPAFTRLTGYSLEEAVGKNPSVLKSGKQDQFFYERLWDTITAGKPWHGELVNKRKDGTLYDEEMTITSVKSDGNKIDYFIAIKQDITERKQVQKALVTRTADLERTTELISILTNLTVQSQAIVEPEKFFDTLSVELKKLGLNYYLALHEEESSQILTIRYIGLESKMVMAMEKILGFNVLGFQFDPMNFSFYKDVFENKEAIFATDTATIVKGLVPFLPNTIIHSLIGLVGGGANFNNAYLPLVSDDQVIGILAVWGKNLKETDLPAFSIFASQVAMTIRVSELYQQAQAASVAKTEFLSRMSHELRTPLNSILGFAQLMELSRKEPLTEGQKMRVKQIEEGGTHLLDLINEILDISRIEAGRLTLSPEPVNVKNVVQLTLDLVKPLADHRNITLKVNEVDDELFVKVDQQRLKQVILNLVSNGIKYNLPNGRVEIQYELKPDNLLRISISDTGMGLSKQQIEKLFNPFERLGAETGEVEGTGLGLALSKKLVELMNGKIGVDSTIGKGSTFWIEFSMVEGTVTKPVKKVTGELGGLTNRGVEILYIEDNPANYELIAQVLDEYSEVTLYWEPDGHKGLETAQNRPFDLILLDLHLPELPGKEVLVRLKRDRTTRSVPVVVLSADATTKQINDIMDLGAEAYLTKPLNIRQFIKLIEKMMANKKRKNV